MIARLLFLIITTIVFFISISSYIRFRRKKNLLLTAGFGLFFIHAVIAIPEIFNQTYNSELTDSIHILMDGAALVLVLAGILKD
jgi:hypothetical protein